MELKTGYKQTEVGVIPEDWEVKLLPEVCRFRSGKAHEQYISEFGQYVCVNSKFISTEGSIRKFSTKNFCPANKGDVLMVMSDLPNGRALAKAYLVEEDEIYAVNQRICCLTAYRDSSEYLFYALNRNKYFLQFDDGVSQTHLLNRVFEKCQIPVPIALVEQAAIAAALSDVDELLVAQDMLIAKKRSIKQGAMQELLTGRRRLPGFGGEFEVKRLSDLCSLKSGEAITAAHIDECSVFPCYGGNGLRGFTKSYTHEGDYALIGRQGALCGNVVSASGKFFASEHALVVTPKVTTDIHWLSHVLRRANLNQYSESSAQPGLSASKLLLLDFLVPPMKEEQTAIAQVLAGIDAEISALEGKREKTALLKKGMMQELLTGRTRLV